MVDHMDAAHQRPDLQSVPGRDSDCNDCCVFAGMLAGRTIGARCMKARFLIAQSLLDVAKIAVFFLGDCKKCCLDI